MQEQTSDVALVFPPPASPNVGYHGSGSCFLSTSPQGVLFPFVFWHVLCLLWSCTCFCIRRQALPRLVLRRRKALRRSCRRQLRVFLLRVFIIAFGGICFCDVPFLCRSGAFPAPPSPPAPAAGCARSSCCFFFALVLTVLQRHCFSVCVCVAAVCAASESAAWVASEGLSFSCPFVPCVPCSFMVLSHGS